VPSEKSTVFGNERCSPTKIHFHFFDFSRIPPGVIVGLEANDRLRPLELAAGRWHSPRYGNVLKSLTGHRQSCAKLRVISGTPNPVNQNPRLLSRYPSDQFVCAGEELINITSAGGA
jgi:hypothetical protein